MIEYKISKAMHDYLMALASTVKEDVPEQQPYTDPPSKWECYATGHHDGQIDLARDLAADIKVVVGV